MVICDRPPYGRTSDTPAWCDVFASRHQSILGPTAADQCPEREHPPPSSPLQIKLLEVEGQSLPIAEFLAKAIDPPVPQAIKAARQLLEDIGGWWG